MAAEAKKVEGEQFEFPDEKDTKKPEEENLPEVTVDTEEDVKIEVIDDTPEEDRKHKQDVARHIQEITEEELATYSENVQKRIKSLSAAWNDERRTRESVQRERQELERVAQQIVEENKKLREYVQTGEKVYQGTAKAAAQAKLDMAKQKYKAAHEAFDADALVVAQQEMISAQLDLQAAENFRPTLQTPQEGVYQQPTVPNRPDERAIRWQARNQWFGTDDEMTALALAAHKRLVANGVDPRSDEYYAAIDKRIHQKFPEYFGETTTPASTQVHRKPATVVAPTVRSSSAKTVKLTQTQANLARRLGISLEEYAKQVALLETPNG